MEFISTELPGVVLVQPKVFGDERGFFMETYRMDKFEQAGIPTRFVQDNHSRSQQGVLRGLHYQIQQAQGKLVRVIAGEVFDVAVDIRRNSPCFGKWTGAQLSAENKREMWVPPGFAHGFYVLSDWAEVTYKTNDYYAPQWERSIAWNDPQICIQWPLIDGQQPSLSGKDMKAPHLADAEVFESDPLS
jgi:dTDP-4-dehydrorhamnose 3,5-epimerase